MRAGTQETLCAQVHGPTEPITLTVTLHVDSADTVVLEEAGIKQDFYRCLNFQVLTQHNVHTHTKPVCWCISSVNKLFSMFKRGFLTSSTALKLPTQILEPLFT